MPDLSVVTKAKDLATYIFTVTQKSPKQFRFSLVGRMQNLCLEVIGHLYCANDIWVDTTEAAHQRLDHQHAALTSLKELDYLLTLSRELGAILPRQQENAGELLTDTQRLLGAWMKSDRQRFRKS